MVHINLEFCIRKFYKITVWTKLWKWRLWQYPLIFFICVCICRDIGPRTSISHIRFSPILCITTRNRNQIWSMILFKWQPMRLHLDGRKVEVRCSWWLFQLRNKVITNQEIKNDMELCERPSQMRWNSRIVA